MGEKKIEKKIIRVADKGFEIDFEKYTSMKEVVREREYAEAEKRIAEQTAKLDELIRLTSHEEEILVEIDEDFVSEESDKENDPSEILEG